MPMMEWNESLKVGHSMIDRNHVKLFGLINELGDAMSDGRGRAVCGKVLNELERYTETHFALEDQLMTVHRYPATDEHRKEHAKLARHVVEFKYKNNAGQLTISVFLLHFLMEWLTHHSLESDKALAQIIPK